MLLLFLRTLPRFHSQGPAPRCLSRPTSHSVPLCRAVCPLVCHCPSCLPFRSPPPPLASPLYLARTRAMSPSNFGPSLPLRGMHALSLSFRELTMGLHVSSWLWCLQVLSTVSRPCLPPVLPTLNGNHILGEHTSCLTLFPGAKLRAF